MNWNNAYYHNSFSHIYVEQQAYSYPLTAGLLARFKEARIIPIRHYLDVFSPRRQDFAAQKQSQKLITLCHGIFKVISQQPDQRKSLFKNGGRDRPDRSCPDCQFLQPGEDRFHMRSDQPGQAFRRVRTGFASCRVSLPQSDGRRDRTQLLSGYALPVGLLRGRSGDKDTDWQQQKEEQARLRRLQNELKRVEDEIASLENRSSEIDELLTREEVYTDVARLMELNQEKKEIDSRLESLMERWEELSE